MSVIFNRECSQNLTFRIAPNLSSKNPNLSSQISDLDTDTSTSLEPPYQVASNPYEIGDPHNHGPNLPPKKATAASKKAIDDSNNNNSGVSKSKHTENAQHPFSHETLKPRNRYSRFNKGPFAVEIDRICDPSIQVLSLGKILHKNFKDEVLECKKKLKNTLSALLPFLKPNDLSGKTKREIQLLVQQFY